jgi:hypothetical protein
MIAVMFIVVVIMIVVATIVALKVAEIMTRDKVELSISLIGVFKREGGVKFAFDYFYPPLKNVSYI